MVIKDIQPWNIGLGENQFFGIFFCDNTTKYR